jgi:transposase
LLLAYYRASPTVNAPARIAELERQLHWAQLKIQMLEEELRQRRIQQLGPRSETLSNLQLQLLADEEPGATRDEVEAESRCETLTRTRGRERHSHPGRKPLPENLRRVTDVIFCKETTCACCGEQTVVIGYDESEQLDIEPAHYFVRLTRREKRACQRCSTVTAAPLAERIVEKGLASDAVVINTVVAKYCDHLPLYRQAVMLEREAGVEIGRATLDGWVMRVGELLGPIVGAMRRDLLAASYYRRTKLRCRFRCTTAAERIIKPICGNTENRVVKQCSTSAWAGDVRVRASFWASGKGFCKPMAMQPTTTSADRSWCMSDVGRTRVASLSTVKVNPQDGAAIAMVTRMDALFLIDRDARHRALTVEERQAHRRQYAEEWLQEIRETCLALAQQALPKSALGQAAAYTLNMWAKLRRCFDYAEVELSNNLAENSMRPVALGRKNWLHVGSAQARPKVAAILSVVESCRRLGVPVKDYFTAVLPGLNRRTLSEVANLTPARWSTGRA